MASTRHLQRARSGDKNLAGVDLSDADLTGLDLSDANLTGANLNGAILVKTDLCGASLEGADLTLAELESTNLSSANLRGAILARAWLRNASLSGADLTGANLTRANLIGAFLDGANLSGATLTGAKITDTKAVLRGHEESKLIAMHGDLQPLGFVVNPKTGELVVAVANVGYVQIVSLDGAWLGTGSFGGYYDLASRVSGMVRVHTAQGVQKPGGGYGTTLYTALALGAHLGGLTMSPDLPRPSDGVSSFACGLGEEVEGRSEEADGWWRRAVGEFCLARRVILRTRKATLKFGADAGCRIDTYLYQTAVERGLVAMVATKPTTLREAWRDFAGSFALASDARPIIAANWGLMAKQDVGGVAVRGAIDVAAKARAISTADARSILERYKSGVSDPPRKPAKRIGCAPGRVVRMNPSSRAEAMRQSLGWGSAW